MRVLFIHHSTGANLIKEGNVRELLAMKAAEIEFWDHSYNLSPNLPGFIAQMKFCTGLSDSSGKMTGKDFHIVLSNNSPKQYAEIFSRDPSDQTLKSILEFDMVAFKNCFPTTKIATDSQLEEYKNYYQKIFQGLQRFPMKKFLLLTSPPLRKELTTFENAKRAKTLNESLITGDFAKDSKNFFTFNLFGLLSDNNGFLKKEYCKFLFWDSHPNKKANEAVAPKFVEKIISTVTSNFSKY